MIYLPVLLLLPFIDSYKIDTDLIIKLNEPKGTIRGHILKSTKGKDFYAFQEIPYAAPPIGENRFKLPKPHVGWEGILDTTENTKQCMQPITSAHKLNNTEDCLYINVYTPVKPGLGKLPVLFFIHGGAFLVGSGAKVEQGPENFMDYGIVVVTINYRLGPFGFLSTGDGVIPSNLGFKDQTFALEWVQKNIHLFSGDPSKVTLWGQSAGATSVSYHLLDRSRTGLFRAAMPFSASSLTRITYTSHKRDKAIDLVKELYPSYNSNSSIDILNSLMNCSAEDIFDAAAKMKSLDRTIGIVNSLVWDSVTESEKDPEPVLTTPFHQSFLEGDFVRVPLLFGFTSEEALTFIQGSWDSVKKKAANLDKDDRLLIADDLNIDNSNKAEAGKRIKKIFTNSTFGNDLVAFIKFSSDESLRIGTIREADVASKYVPVYLFEFSYTGVVNKAFHNNYSVPGIQSVGHGEELFYLWTADPLNLPKFPEEDRLVSARFLRLITNFVKYLNPTPEKDELLNNINWPLLNGDTLPFLNINGTLEVSSNPTRYTAYRDILLEYIRKPFIVFS